MKQSYLKEFISEVKLLEATLKDLEKFVNSFRLDFKLPTPKIKLKESLKSEQIRLRKFTNINPKLLFKAQNYKHTEDISSFNVLIR